MRRNLQKRRLRFGFSLKTIQNILLKINDNNETVRLSDVIIRFNTSLYYDVTRKDQNISVAFNIVNPKSKDELGQRFNHFFNTEKIVDIKNVNYDSDEFKNLKNVFTTITFTKKDVVKSNKVGKTFTFDVRSLSNERFFALMNDLIDVYKNYENATVELINNENRTIQVKFSDETVKIIEKDKIVYKDNVVIGSTVIAPRIEFDVISFLKLFFKREEIRMKFDELRILGEEFLTETNDYIGNIQVGDNVIYNRLYTKGTNEPISAEYYSQQVERLKQIRRSFRVRTNDVDPAAIESDIHYMINKEVLAKVIDVYVQRRYKGGETDTRFKLEVEDYFGDREIIENVRREDIYKIWDTTEIDEIEEKLDTITHAAVTNESVHNILETHLQSGSTVNFNTLNNGVIQAVLVENNELNNGIQQTTSTSVSFKEVANEIIKSQDTTKVASVMNTNNNLHSMTNVTNETVGIQNAVLTNVAFNELDDDIDESEALQNETKSGDTRSVMSSAEQKAIEFVELINKIDRFAEQNDIIGCKQLYDDYKDEFKENVVKGVRLYFDCVQRIFRLFVNKIEEENESNPNKTKESARILKKLQKELNRMTWKTPSSSNVNRSTTNETIEDIVDNLMKYKREYDLLQ